jgi:hypothetical protein
MNSHSGDPLSSMPAQLEVTWNHALQVWWAWQWRASVLTVLVVLVTTLLFAMLGLEAYNTIRVALCSVFVLLANVYVIKDILNHQFARFRICVLPTDAPVQ